MASTINASTTAGLIQTGDTSGQLQLQTNSGQTAVTIDTSQNVGIGITPSAWGTSLSQKAIQIGPVTSLSSLNGGGGNYQLNLSNNAFFDGSNWKYIVSDSANLYTQVNGTHKWSYVTSGTAGNTITFTEAMRIDSSGNVLVGNAGLISGTTSSPRLYVVGTTPVVDSGAGGQQLIVTSSETSGEDKGGVIGLAGPSASSGVNIKATIAGKYESATGGNAGYMQFATLNSGGALAERMRIASNGQMLLGTTTNSGRSPPLIISNDSGTTNWAVGPSSGGSTQFYVSAGAGVYLSSTSATSWTANSDERLKNITGKIENALDAISTLTPAKFTWKSDEENTPQIGLIAQEVEKVLPEVVDKNADGYLGVRYTETIPLLVAAIQEQQTIINDLKARITALEGAK